MLLLLCQEFQVLQTAWFQLGTMETVKVYVFVCVAIETNKCKEVNWGLGLFNWGSSSNGIRVFSKPPTSCTCTCFIHSLSSQFIGWALSFSFLPQNLENISLRYLNLQLRTWIGYFAEYLTLLWRFWTQRSSLSFPWNFFNQ